MDFFDMRLLSFIGIKKIPDAPWEKYYKKEDMKYSIPNENIYDFLVKKINDGNYYNKTAINYYNKRISYYELLNKIDEVALKFQKLKIKKYEIVTIISANIPEAIISFYALNKIGAVVNLLHPLLSENEIKDALNMYHTKYLFAMDVTIEKINNIINETNVSKVVILSPESSMKILKRFLYKIISYNSRYHGYLDSKFISWNDFIKNKGVEKIEVLNFKKDDPALILQSGGTTGIPKGIVLSNGNVNAATIATLKTFSDLNQNDVILGIMPIFHGFGLEVSINDAFSVGAEVVLVPKFKAKKFDELLRKYRPTVLVGVPTLYEALVTNKNTDDLNFSNLKYVISGGDTLSKEKVLNINKFLFNHGSHTNLIQGYGLTEAVAQISVDLKNNTHPGTIGIPLPGIYVKIFEPNTEVSVPYNQDGEICVCGPIVMLGYYNNESETNQALKLHKDGNIWLHTGDIGSMDENGFITYKQRLKRMIITSGYNVYPSRIEEVLMKHKAVLTASVIGIPHPYKQEVAKAYIVLNKGYYKSEKLINELSELCKKNLAYYSIPKEFEFRSSLPKTIVGKVDFNKLQDENKKI